MRLRRVAAALIGVVSVLTASGAAYASPSQGQLAARQAAIVVNHPTGVASSAGGVLDSRGNLVKGGTAIIPRHATDGVHIGNGQNAVVISLSDADNTANGVVNNGVMTYGSKQSTDDVVVPTSNGAQFLKVLNGPLAPETFSYHIQVPVGGKLVTVTDGPNGDNHTGVAALVLNGKGNVAGSISLPWAHDQNGTSVKTYFTVQGDTLTQHVLPHGKSLTYPIVADPFYRWYKTGVVITMSYGDMQDIAGGGITVASGLVMGSIPTGLGVIPASAISGLLMSVVSGASWGVATHNCFWFWIPYPGVWSHPDTGYYSCH